MRERVYISDFIPVPDMSISHQLVRLRVQVEDEMELLVIPMITASKLFDLCIDQLEDCFFKQLSSNTNKI
jgi:hypothetical protein